MLMAAPSLHSWKSAIWTTLWTPLFVCSLKPSIIKTAFYHLKNSITAMDYCLVCPAKCRTSCNHQIIPTLKHLHWLPIRSRILYEILLIYKSLHCLVSQYLSNLLILLFSLQILRSTYWGLLSTPTPDWEPSGIEFLVSLPSSMIHNTPSLDLKKKKHQKSQ